MTLISRSTNQRVRASLLTSGRNVSGSLRLTSRPGTGGRNHPVGPQLGAAVLTLPGHVLVAFSPNGRYLAGVDPSPGPESGAVVKVWDSNPPRIDEIRLEEKAQWDEADYQPPGSPLARVLAKLKAGKPVTVVTVRGSPADFSHPANPQVSGPPLLKDWPANRGGLGYRPGNQLAGPVALHYLLD